MSTPHDRRSRTTLLDTTFWEVLPAQYELIELKWETVADLYAQAKHTRPASNNDSDRARAASSLKTELEELSQQVDEYRQIASRIDIAHVAGLYAVAGYVPEQAMQMAEDRVASLRRKLIHMKDMIGEIGVEMQALLRRMGVEDWLAV